jgi:RHS repeat-associated protein
MYLNSRNSPNRVGIRNSTDYSPFGVGLDGRTVSVEGYRFGYQGSEKDNEFKGEGKSYTTEFRQLDPRLGRWLSVDPMKNKFPEWSTYTSMNNNPQIFNDKEGNTVKDWIKDSDGRYIWDNSIKSPSQVKKGQKYIGKEDSDIVKDLFGRSSFRAETQDSGIFSFEQDNNFVASFHATISTTLSVVILPKVKYNGNARTFEGIKFYASTEGYTNVPLLENQKMKFNATKVSFNGVKMLNSPEYDGPSIKPLVGSLSFEYYWSATRIYSDYGKTYPRKVSMEGYYTFGENPLRHMTIAGYFLPFNKTTVSLNLNYHNK